MAQPAKLTGKEYGYLAWAMGDGIVEVGVRCGTTRSGVGNEERTTQRMDEEERSRATLRVGPKQKSKKYNTFNF